MNQNRYYGPGLAILMFPVAGVTEGIAAGPKTSWIGVPEDVAPEAAIAQAVAQYPLSNAELLASLQRNRPPQSWYDEDHEGLY